MNVLSCNSLPVQINFYLLCTELSTNNRALLLVEKVRKSFALVDERTFMRKLDVLGFSNILPKYTYVLVKNYQCKPSGR